MISKEGIYTIRVDDQGMIVDVEYNGIKGTIADYDSLPPNLFPVPVSLCDIYFHPAGRCMKLPGCGWR